MRTDLSPSPAYLGALSAVAGQSYASMEEATAAILRLVAEQLGLRSAFVARIERESGRFTVLAAHNQPDGCGIQAGEAPSLEHHF